jgi:hypothetical protein
VNAAFLLVTTAWMAGADAPPPPTAEPIKPPAGVTTPAPGTPAPVVSTPVGGGCGCSSAATGCGCEGGGHEGLFAKLKARFASGGCGCESAPACGCESSHESFFTKLKGKFAHSTSDCGCGCAPAPSHVSASCGCDSGPSFFEKLKAHFSHGSSCGCESAPSCGCCGSSSAVPGTIYSPGAPVATPPVGEPIKPPKETDPKKLPEGGKEPVKDPSKGARGPALNPEVTPTGANNVEGGLKNPFELDRRYESRVDRAADYGWLTGQLFYVHADGGLWVLRYAPLSKEDANGGGVVLARDRDMDSYREGDLVTVRGDVLNAKGTPYLGAPLYRVQSIELVERNRP